jgi:hypothetical protein
MKNIIAVVLLFIMFSTNSFADYAKGFEAYNNDDYATALKEWEPLAEQGDSDAQYNLGRMYDHGKGVLQNYTTAIKWYSAAAEQGNADANFEMGRMYHNGKGVSKDYIAASKWYKAAAEQGHAVAQNNLGLLYNEGQELLDEGEGLLPQDYDVAFKWFTASATQGFAKAQFNLGVMYDQGQGVSRDYLTARKWYKVAAEQGHASAQYNLGHLYLRGEGVPQDYMMAIKWFTRAAESEDADAEYILGSMYADGLGVPEDENTAIEWYKKAAKQGNTAAQEELERLQNSFRYVFTELLELSLIFLLNPVIWVIVIFVSIRRNDYWKPAIVGVLGQIACITFYLVYRFFIEGDEGFAGALNQIGVERLTMLYGACIFSGITISALVFPFVRLSQLRQPTTATA